MKKFLKMALALLPLAVMSSCAADDPIIDDSDGIAKKTETRYLQVTLSGANGAPGTRLPGDAASYQDASAEENKIKTIEFYFYDSKGQFHSHVPVDLATNDKNGNKLFDTEDVDDGTRPNIDALYHCNVPVELVQGETLPNYVICIINAVASTAYLDKPMADAQKMILESLYGSVEGEPNTYFGMSNSVYYGRDEVTGLDNQLIMATPFQTEKLKTASELEKLEKQGENAMKDVTVNIYVERYAAKVNLDLTSTTYTAYSTSAQDKNNTISLNFNPKGWCVNAVENRFFFLKAFRTADASEEQPSAQEGSGISGFGNEFEDFTTLNGLLFDGWNNPEHHRSFWARTPGYYVDDYPVVADDVETDEKNPAGKYSVKYYNYKHCITDHPVTKGQKYSIYTFETTMKKSRLTGYDSEGNKIGDQYMPMASIPSVVIVGQYTINDATEPVDFYTYGERTEGEGENKVTKKVIYSGSANPIEGTVNIQDAMLENQSIIVHQDENNPNIYIPINAAYVSTNGMESLFSVKHPNKEVLNTTISGTSSQATTGSLKIAADVVVLQLTGPESASDESKKLYFYDTYNKTYSKITEANINLVNRLLLQNLGGARYYKQGMAFFTAPIEHWGWQRSDNDNKGKGYKYDEWDWSAMKTGDFGIVRNHIYEMKIGKIEGLGTGIKDENEPIVPPADKVGYAVHFHVNIQKWAVLPVQNWDF